MEPPSPWARTSRNTALWRPPFRFHRFDFLEKNLDKVFLFHFSYGLSVLEQDAEPPAPGNADVRLGSLAGPVDDTSHDRDLQILFHPRQFFFDLFDHGRQVDLAAPAGRAGDDVGPDLPDAEGPQDAVSDGHLDGRIPCDGHPDRVADPF